MTVYDIGAFHGLLTYFASQSKTVISFEPNSQNRKRLMENLSLNGIKNVQVRNVGVGSVRETRKMVVSPLMPGASVDANMEENLLRSGVGMLAAEEGGRAFPENRNAGAKETVIKSSGRGCSWAFENPEHIEC